MMIDNILVFFIVAGAIIYLLRIFYKQLRGKNKGCACDESCTTCDKSAHRHGDFPGPPDN